MTTLAQFEQLKSAGYNLIPVYRQRLADTDTPLSVFARLQQHQQAYLFESVEGAKTGHVTRLLVWVSQLYFPAMLDNLQLNFQMGELRHRHVLIHFNIFVTFRHSLKCLRNKIYLRCQILQAAWLGILVMTQYVILNHA